MRGRPRSSADLLPDEPRKLGHDEIHHLVRDPRINADPEGLPHRDVRVRQVTDDPALDALIRGLPQGVAGKDLPRGKPTGLQMRDEVAAGERSLRADRDREAEPLDGDRVFIATGLAAGKRLVVQGAELLGQVR